MRVASEHNKGPLNDVPGPCRKKKDIQFTGNFQCTVRNYILKKKKKSWFVFIFA